MSIKYDSKRESLSEIIKKATVDATYVIPDLQRPYVWTPRQVTMLVDSVFRGWPFGSLLLWEVKPDCFLQNEGIPHRPFWQVVDRTRSDQGAIASALGQPATYQMVLDGQQRVQSLILALGGDQWGFLLLDSDWALDLQERRVKPSRYWSRGGLCIDLEKFTAEMEAKSGKVRKIEAGKTLEWVVLDSVAGQSPEPRPINYVFPLPTAKDNPGRFIRLSRLWNLAQKDLSEREYKGLLDPILKEHGATASVRETLLEPLAEFMKVVENVKNNSFVHALQIESFELTPQWTKDDYSDAIVNIFTRLNTAGRTLTREEITLAWLKVGWVPSQTDGKPAGQCLEELKAAFGDRGFQLETDEIVRLIAFVWSVENRGGKLLDSRDLLKGDIIRSLAHTVAGFWKRLLPRLERGADFINERDLLENQGSFNAIIVFLAWYRAVFDRMDELNQDLRVVEKDDLDKQLSQRASGFLDRWIFGSQWASVWGDAAVVNFQNFATDLSETLTTLRSTNLDKFLTVVDASVETLINRIRTRASEHVTNATVRDRRRVHTYYGLLWVWHRLDKLRWQHSSLPMRTGRKRTSKLEVDHSVADAWWERLVLEDIGPKLEQFRGPEEEKFKIAPDGFDTRYDAFALVNLLGNCSLLDKSFNVSKSDQPMWSFLKDVHEFKEGKVVRGEWESALSLSETLTSPETHSLIEIKEAIQKRDFQIRNELLEFLAGTRVRVDS